MKHIALLLSIFYLFLSCNYLEQKNKNQIVEEEVAQRTISQNQIICADPDAPGICMFMDMPTNVDHRINTLIPGEKQNLLITGKVINASIKKPYSDIYIYAYHTDKNGLYTKSGSEQGVQKIHGQHHGWCVTDEEGNYEIHSIRPGMYPSRNTPAHIHAWIKIDDDHIFYLNDFVFADDPLVDSSYEEGLDNKNNPKELDNGILKLTYSDEKFIGKRDIMILE